MIAYAGRPLPETPLEDRRPACGLRRWTIDPANWDRCTDLSANGVWPAMDTVGHRVLGQFRTPVSQTHPDQAGASVIVAAARA